MSTRKLHYSEFAHKIDVDAFEAAIGFEPFTTDRSNDIGHCIFPENHKHGDTTGKFAIERDERLYNCFVCGGGTLLSLAMEIMGLDVEEATEWIYQFAHGSQQTDHEFADDLLAMLEDATARATTMAYFNDRVLDRFDGPLDYFFERGISASVAERYNLRYSESAFKAAPIKTLHDGTKMKAYENYNGPASIWPHYWQGALVGWQYRWHDYPNTPKWLPKWTNTTDFPKGTTLYNYDIALTYTDPVVVCESLGTVCFCATYNVPAVAYFGAKPTDEQKRLLRRFQQGVILAPDNDANMAGDKILGVVDYLERYIPVLIAEKVEGKDGADLNDYCTTDDPGKHLHNHLKHRVHEAGLAL